MILTTLEGEEAVIAAKQTLAQNPGNRDIIEMVSTILVYIFTQLSRAKVDSMLGTTLQETRVYQEAKAEGKLEMLSMLLNHRFGSLPNNMTEQLASLSIEQLETLGTAMFDFRSLADLAAWLES
jgi:predicted transposase YdaD